jgi:hypothetical protein
VSPPPAESKNDAFRLRAVGSIVTATAGTGRESSSGSAVMETDRANRGIRSGFLFFGFILTAVEVKFTAPRMVGLY